MHRIAEHYSYTPSIAESLNASLASWSPYILLTSAAALTIFTGYNLYNQKGEEKAIRFQSTINESSEIRKRIQQTYQYVFGGFAVTAVVATLAHISRVSLAVLHHPYISTIAFFGVSIGSFYTIHQNPTEENKKTRQIAWAIFTASTGILLSPLGFFDKSIVAQAALISLGTGGLLTLTAFLDSSKKFLTWKGPLYAALTTMTFAGAIATFFPRTAFAYGIDRVSLYGGIALFAAYFLYDTQKLKKDAESKKTFDPIRSSIDVYLNSINIFLKILRILQENAEKKKTNANK